MAETDNKINQALDAVKKDFGLFFSIGLGVFLFVLFFKPFPFNSLDLDNMLLVIAGLGAIIFLFMIIARIIFPLFVQNYVHALQVSILSASIHSIIIITLSSVAFAFYLRYVGGITITFYIMFKVVLICFASVIILRIYDINRELKKQIKTLVNEKKVIQKHIEKYEEDFLNKSIEFISDNKTENLNLFIADIVLLKSANNYVEIVYIEDDVFKKKLIRNTLKNIEIQIKSYTNFIRCHRICIVNSHFIEKLNRNYNSHWLTIKGYNEKIPVSRQYLLKLKETV